MECLLCDPKLFLHENRRVCMACREESRSDVGYGGKKKSDHNKFELGGTKYLMFPNSQKIVFVMSTDYIFVFYTD
jgi:hypothetical protein